jgi:hypothetical protein
MKGSGNFVLSVEQAERLQLQLYVPLRLRPLKLMVREMTSSPFSR